MKLSGTGVLALAALGVVAWIAYEVKANSKSVKDAAAAVADKLNPASRNNVVYTGVNAAGAAVTGDDNFNLGVKVWEWLNPKQAAADSAMGTTPAGNVPTASSLPAAQPKTAADVFTLNGDIGGAAFPLFPTDPKKSAVFDPGYRGQPGVGANPDDPLAFGYTLH